MENGKNKLAMVTGGSGGIGFELAKQFADHGFDVAISGQSDRVHESAEELRSRGVEAYPYQADASTYDGVEGFWRFVEDLGRPVDAAALNVGIGLGGAFVEMTWKTSSGSSRSTSPGLSTWPSGWHAT